MVVCLSLNAAICIITLRLVLVWRPYHLGNVLMVIFLALAKKHPKDNLV